MKLWNVDVIKEHKKKMKVKYLKQKIRNIKINVKK